MSDQPGNADRSMAREVERLLRQLGRPTTAPRVPSPTAPRGISRPVAPPSRSLASTRPTPRAAAARPVTIPAPLGVWGRLVLATLLAAALTQWPYPRCGFPLALYLAAVGMLLVAAVWAAHSAWQARSGRAHVVAIILLFAGAALAATQVLPRLGYSPVEVTWRCPR